MPATLGSEFLMSVDADVAAPMPVGQTPFGTRMIADIKGGTFEGPRLKGDILPSGGDWLLVRGDGSFQIDVRAALKTHDGAMIYMQYLGRWHFPPEVGAKLFDPEQAASVSPDDYYFRTTPYFETGDERYAWLNGIVAVGVGATKPGGVRYEVHAIT
ncbi:MAG: DUF3237 domain-containing protein [Pseudomonadota bacterium]